MLKHLVYYQIAAIPWITLVALATYFSIAPAYQPAVLPMAITAWVFSIIGFRQGYGSGHEAADAVSPDESGESAP